MASISEIWIRGCTLSIRDPQADEMWIAGGFHVAAGGKRWLVTARHALAPYVLDGHRVAARAVQVDAPVLDADAATVGNLKRVSYELEPTGILDHASNVSGRTRNSVFGVRLESRPTAFDYPFVDVAALPVPEDVPVSPLGFWREADLVEYGPTHVHTPGDVFGVVAYPNDYWQHRRMMAFVRSGFLATPPQLYVDDYPCFGATFLSHEGMSGAPVVRNPGSSVTKRSDGYEISKFKLAGILVACQEERHVSWVLHARCIAELLRQGEWRAWDAVAYPDST